MNRLTVRGAVSQKDINKLLELSNENQFGINEVYYKLQHYEDLEEGGNFLLSQKALLLPCMIGDIVYTMEDVYGEGELNIAEYKITNINVDSDMYVTFVAFNTEDVALELEFSSCDMGETIFKRKEDLENHKKKANDE